MSRALSDRAFWRESIIEVGQLCKANCAILSRGGKPIPRCNRDSQQGLGWDPLRKIEDPLLATVYWTTGSSQDRPVVMRRMHGGCPILPVITVPTQTSRCHLFPLLASTFPGEHGEYPVSWCRIIHMYTIFVHKNHPMKF